MEFRYNSRTIDGKYSQCKECERKSKMKDYYGKYRDGYSHQAFKRFYGSSLHEYKKLLEDQNYTCAICNTAHTEEDKLCMDHNHKTGDIRGLLCQNCNKGLGYLKDDIKLIDKAKEYLSKEPIKRDFLSLLSSL